MSTTLKVIRVKLSVSGKDKTENDHLLLLTTSCIGVDRKQKGWPCGTWAFCKPFKHQIPRSAARGREAHSKHTHFGNNDNVRGWIYAIRTGQVPRGTETNAVNLPWRMASRGVLLGFSEAKESMKQNHLQSNQRLLWVSKEDIHSLCPSVLALPTDTYTICKQTTHCAHMHA